MAATLRDSTFADKAYKGYFVGFKWPLLDKALVYVPALDKIQESGHVIFDEVTPVRRETDILLMIDPQRKAIKDFLFLVNLAYEDSDSKVMYVTTRITTSRGFIVGYRAPMTQQGLGKEEQIPIHAKDVEKMVLAQWQHGKPLVLSDNRLTSPCTVLPILSQGAPEVDPHRRADHPRGRLGPEPTRPHNTSAIGASPDGDVSPATMSRKAPCVQAADSGPRAPLPSGGDLSTAAIHDGLQEAPRSSRPGMRSPRDRTPRTLHNATTLGGDTAERVHYLAAEAMAVEADDRDPVWNDSKLAEVRSQILEQSSFVIEPLPTGRRKVGSRWVLKTKVDGRRKARFCVKGYSQQEGIDYKETWAPVAKLITLRIFLTLVAILSLYTAQLDLKTAFLNASLKEEIYCAAPYDLSQLLLLLLKTLTLKTERDKITAMIHQLELGGVLRLLKAVYGLRQAPREWWLMLHAFLGELGFVPNKIDVCFNTLHLPNGGLVLLLLYVDDIILAATSSALAAHYSALISKRFRVSSEGPLSTYLGFDIRTYLSQHRVELSMAGYVERMYKRFRLVPKQSVTTPLPEGIQAALEHAPLADEQFVEDFEYRQKIGCLLYYMICMKVNICFAVGLLSRFSN